MTFRAQDNNFIVYKRMIQDYIGIYKNLDHYTFTEKKKKITPSTLFTWLNPLCSYEVLTSLGHEGEGKDYHLLTLNYH